MNQVVAKFGFWSAFACLVAFVIWIFCFVLILKTNQLFLWTNLEEFIKYNKTYNQNYKYFAQFAMMIAGIAFMILLHCIYENLQENRKYFSRIALTFGGMFTLLISVNYFIQLSTIRLHLIKGNFTGLEQFIMSNPISAMNAINMLGWTVFLGLASIFIASTFQTGKLERVIHYSFLSNGIICLLGGIGYVLNIMVIVFVCMNIGMGISMMMAAVGSIRFFGRELKRSNIFRMHF